MQVISIYDPQTVASRYVRVHSNYALCRLLNHSFAQLSREKREGTPNLTAGWTVAFACERCGGVRREFWDWGYVDMTAHKWTRPKGWSDFGIERVGVTRAHLRRALYPPGVSNAREISP